MWTLIIVTMLIHGNSFGATFVKNITFTSEVSCKEASEKLNKMFTPGLSDELKRHPVQSFCVQDHLK